MFGEWRPSSGKFDDEQKKIQDQYLEKAMTFFKQEGSRSTANDIRKQMTERKALNGQYELAAKEYESIAKEVLDQEVRIVLGLAICERTCGKQKCE